MSEIINSILNLEKKADGMDSEITEFETAIKAMKAEKKKLNKIKLDLMELEGITEEQLNGYRPKKEEAPTPESAKQDATPATPAAPKTEDKKPDDKKPDTSNVKQDANAKK